MKANGCRVKVRRMESNSQRVDAFERDVADLSKRVSLRWNTRIRSAEDQLFAVLQTLYVDTNAETLTSMIEMYKYMYNTMSIADDYTPRHILFREPLQYDYSIFTIETFDLWEGESNELWAAKIANLFCKKYRNANRILAYEYFLEYANRVYSKPKKEELDCLHSSDIQRICWQEYTRWFDAFRMEATEEGEPLLEALERFKHHTGRRMVSLSRSRGYSLDLKQAEQLVETWVHEQNVLDV